MEFDTYFLRFFSFLKTKVKEKIKELNIPNGNKNRFNLTILLMELFWTIMESQVRNICS